MQEPHESRSEEVASPSEEEAWAAVVAAWSDEAAHRAYLARFADLDGLAVAAGRYRAVLSERPGDPVAARFREEIVRRATVVGLASLPRTQPAKRPGALRKVVIVASIVFGAAAAWSVWQLVHLLLLPGARP
jgi:hypothetical protein